MNHRPRRLTRHPRPGFTLPEILIVIVMISVLALIAIPRFSLANGKRHMESARLRVGAALVTARQAAIQRGQTVQFAIKSNRVTVVAGGINLISPVPLDTLYKVTADNGANTTIDFTSRGFATLADKKVVTLRRAGLADDSVLVTKTGMVQR
jgi:prepilin-type N-terminal cleavage/methylation domain-containing protein